MEVIFLENVQSAGQRGDLKQVSAGFARNFLIPRKLALPATPALKRQWQLERERKKKEEENRQQKMKETVERLRGLTLSFEERANEEGTLFSGITKERIAEQIKNTAGIEVEPKSIILDRPLKHSGRYPVGMTIHHTACTIIVTINK